MEMHERLVTARKAAGYETAADAARAVGASYPTYAGHENGSSGFRAGTAAVYARKFGVSFEWLMRGRGNMMEKSEDPDLAELIQQLRDARPEVRKAVRILLDQRMTEANPKLAAGSKGRRTSNRK